MVLASLLCPALPCFALLWFALFSKGEDELRSRK